MKKLAQNEKQFIQILPKIQSADAKCTIYCQLGMIKIHQQKREEALMYFNDALQVNPNHQTALIIKGVITLLMKSVDEAVRFLEKSIFTMMPKVKVQLLKKICHILDKEGLRQRALFYLKQLLIMVPDDEQIMRHMAVAYFHEKEYQQAAEYLEKIILINNQNNQNQLCLLSNCYFKLGQFDKSQTYFIKLLQTNPNQYCFQQFDLGFSYLNIFEFRRAFLFYSKIEYKYPKFKTKIFFHNQLAQIVSSFEIVAFSRLLKLQQQKEDLKKCYLYCKNIQLLIDRFPSLFQIVEDTHFNMQWASKHCELIRQKCNINKWEKIFGQQMISIVKNIFSPKSYIKIRILKEIILSSNKRNDKQMYENYLQFFQQSINEVHQASLALTEIKLSFSLNSSIYKGKYAKQISQYLQYSRRKINFIKCSNEPAIIQEHLKKILSFPKIIFIEKDLPEEIKKTQIDFLKISNEILSLTTNKEKQQYIQAFTFRHFIKAYYLNFIYNNIFFFYTFERSTQLTQLLSRINMECQFQHKSIKYHLLNIMERENYSKFSQNINSALSCMISQLQTQQNFVDNNDKYNMQSDISFDLSDVPEKKSTENLKKIESQLLKFSSQIQYYDDFRKLVMKNVYLTFDYLSSKNGKSKLIVQCIQPKKWNFRYFEKGFYVRTRKGNNISTTEEKVIEGIWELGRDYVYSWITSIASAIIQLETMGLFHCDIKFTNTVLFEKVFKIIDFDYLFLVKRVGPSQIEKQAYQNMIAMIKEFLKIGKLIKDDNIICFLFRRFDQSNLQFSNSFNYDIYIKKMLERIIKSKDQVNKLLKELEAYSQVLHLLQFKRLVNMLFSQNIVLQFADVMSQRQVTKIIECLDWLGNKQIRLKQFVKQVSKIKEKNIQ